MIKVGWIQEWFKEMTRKTGEYYSPGRQLENGNWYPDCIDGDFPLSELADYLNKKSGQE